jgi:hypothetical protein
MWTLIISLIFYSLWRQDLRIEQCREQIREMRDARGERDKEDGGMGREETAQRKKIRQFKERGDSEDRKGDFFFLLN